MASNPGVVTDFVPVDSAPTGEFHPVEPGPVPEDARRTETFDPGYSIPSALFRAEQGKNVLAGTARYGVPIAGGLATGGMGFFPAAFTQAGVTGLGEITARQIEQAGSDPTLDSMWEDLKAGGVSAGLDLGINAALKGLGSGFRWLGDKILIPKTLPPQVEVALNVLGSASKQAAREAPIPKGSIVNLWEKFTGGPKKRPFSLTLGQINAEEHNMINWLEGVARSGLGGRKTMTAFDLRNENAVRDMVADYMEKRTSQMTDPEFGVMMNRILGSGEEAFNPVNAFKKYLYAKFDQSLSKVTTPVDGSKLREYFSNGRGNKFINDVRSGLRSRGLIPPLDAVDDVSRTVRTTRITSRDVSGVSDVVSRTGQAPDALGEAKRKVTEKVGTSTGSTAATTTTTREILGGSQPMTEEQIAEAWRNLSTKDTYDIIEGINALWSKTEQNQNNMLTFMRRQIEPDFIKTVESIPGTNDLWQTAKKYYGLREDAFQNQVITSLRKKLENSPSTVAHMLSGIGENPAATYDKLHQIKKTLYFSAATPDTQLSKSAAKELGISEETRGILKKGGLGTKAIEQMWENDILRPLRYRFITNATTDGIFDAKKFLSTVNNIEKTTPELLKELFGNTTQIETMKRFAETLEVINSGTERNIFIQLKQAGALGRIGAATLGMGAVGAGAGVGGGLAAYSGSDPRVGALGGAVTVMIAPVALAKMFTNPRIVTALTDGLQAGINSRPFAVALRKLSGQWAAGELNDYYHTIPIQMEPRNAANQP